MGTTGVIYGATVTSQAFVAGDRGCLPVLAGTIIAAAATGSNQATNAQMVLGGASTATTAGVLNDLLALQSNLCSVYGGCCYSNYCNPATKTVFNPVNLALTLVFSLISYVAIF